MQKNERIGFIGQGWIGKNYANDFESRGYDIVRYSLEEPYINNKEKIKECNIIFIAVPTPSTPEGFDDSILRAAIDEVTDGTTIVIKSTIFPGTTEAIQADYPNLYIFHSPEFLREVSAAHDSAFPSRNIIGSPVEGDEYKQKAQAVLAVLPVAPYELLCDSKTAEIIKYGGNNFLYFKTIYMNLLSDLANATNCNWDLVKDAMMADDRIGSSHMDPVHQSGRGAGGHCFIKDFAAFDEMYKKHVSDKAGLDLLKSMQRKNIDLLSKSNKDLGLLKGVYGEDYLNF